MPEVTAIYAGLLGLMSIVVAFPAGKLRGETGISIGDGGNQELLLAMRRQANFIEVVPLALILLAIMEMNGVTVWAIHGLGAALIIARVSHALGLKADTIQGFGRAFGAGMSALVILVASIWSLVTFFT